MRKLIKSQFRLVFHNKLFYICLALVVLLDPIFRFSGILDSATRHSLVFPGIAGFFEGQLDIIGIVFIVVFCCYDFNDGTTKNIIGRGYTRKQLILSKYIVSLLSLFIIYAVTCLLYFVLFIKNGFGFESDLVYPLINSIVSIIAYTVIYGTVALLIEKNGYSIVVCLFAPNIINLALGIADSKFKMNISQFWIEGGANKFLEKPTFGNLSLSILYYVVYIVIFAFIAIKVSESREIK